MYTYNKQIITAAVIASMSALSACSSDDDDEEVEPTTADVSIQFAAQVNGADFTCGDTYTGVGTGGHDFQMTDFRLYVHEVHIHDALTDETHEVALTQDGIWQLDDVVLLDFADGSTGCTDSSPEMNTTVKGTVTVPATIDLATAEVCFEVGLPVEKNHLDEATAASPLNASGMLWAWKIGRKFIRIDGFGDPTGVNEPFNIHLGSQGCPATGAGTAPPTSECTEPNTFEVCIANFDVENSVIAVDPALILEGNDVSTNLSLGGTAKPGCQSFIDDDDCEEIMPRLGLNYDYGRSVTGVKSTHSAGQKLFSKQ